MALPIQSFVFLFYTLMIIWFCGLTKQQNPETVAQQITMKHVYLNFYPL